jgi:hypothetical protein
MLVSCGRQKSEWKGTIEEVDGRTVVSNPKTPEMEMRIVFEEELTIGETEGEENYMFGSQVIFNTDEEGNFYVTDWDRKRIQKYDPNGKYLLTIGRLGQGPGEFKNISKAKFDKDNNIYVTDISSRRISFFNKDGKFLRQIKSPISLSHNLYLTSKGLFIFRQSEYLDYPSGVSERITIIGIFDDKFNLLAEIHKEKEEEKPPSGRDEESMAQAQADVISGAAFKPSISYVMNKNDHIYFGDSKKYVIKVYNPEGKLVRIIQREYDPIKVSKRDIDEFNKWWNEYIFKTLLLPDGIKKRAFQLAKYPKYKPAYERFTLMENGWLFVIVDTIEDEYSLIDIFDEDGKYIAQFKTPVTAKGTMSEFLFFKNSKAYSVASENDYLFVKRYNFEIQEYKDGKLVKKNN